MKVAAVVPEPVAPAPAPAPAPVSTTVKLPTATTKFADSLVTLVRKKVKAADISLVSGGGVMSEVREWIPTGFIGLDAAFGGGWAVGRCSEVAGEEGCGKSALAQMACIQTQKMGGLVVYLDFEHALDPGKMEGLGLNPDGLIYYSPDYIEQAWDVIWATVEQLTAKPPPAPTLFVWDSVGGSLAKAQFESSAEDAHVGAVSRVMTPNCAKLFKRIAKCRAHVMFINQERAAIGKFARFGPPPKSTTGGAGLKYAASLRVRCQRVSTLKAGGTTGPAIGYLIRVTTDKNRLVPPHRKATWYLDFAEGPSPDLTLFEVLRDGGRLVKVEKSDEYRLRGVKGLQVSRADFSARLHDDPEFRTAVEGAYLTHVQSGFVGATAPTEDTPESD